MKKVLVIGENSYIGTSFKTYLETAYPNQYISDSLSVRDDSWKNNDFSKYDVVFNCAGIAHVKETKDNKKLYYRVNRDLAADLAGKAKADGVYHFVHLSTMSVYGILEGHIKNNTIPHPVNAYGQSKLEADEKIKTLEDKNFKFSCIRPPMVYGKNCRGNYQSLRSFVLKIPIFPEYDNKRSMIYIGNLCEFIRCVIDNETGGLFFPQNGEYVKTSEMAEMIAKIHGKKLKMTKAFNWAVKKGHTNIVKKVFGSLTYEMTDGIDKYGFKKSIELTEGN